MNLFCKVASILIIFVLSFSFLPAQNIKPPKSKKKTERTTVIPGEKNSSHDDSMLGTVEWKVVLKDDNANMELPDRFKNWWYVKITGVDTAIISKFHIEGDGYQGQTVVLPVYSYDQENWIRFKREEIIRGTEEENNFDYSIMKKFDKPVVWLARYYPYTFKRLEKVIKKYEKNPLMKKEIIGKTAHGRPIYMLTITDPKTDNKTKKRIFIHARTHPSETGGSFLVEGLLDYLLSDCCSGCKDVDLSKLIFNIVPMVNIDGVVEGMARVSPETSYDLERMWIRKPGNLDLQDTVPPVVKSIHDKYLQLIRKGPEVIAAFNIHTKNAFPGWQPFIYTNYMKENDKLGAEADSLFLKQLNFIKLLSEEYCCADTLNLRPSLERQIPMEEKFYPEAWWWLNYKDKVLAATLELTSNSEGGFDDVTNYRDHMMMGQALAKAIYKYYRYFIKYDYYRYETPESDTDLLMKYYKGSGVSYGKGK